MIRHTEQEIREALETLHRRESQQAMVDVIKELIVLREALTTIASDENWGSDGSWSAASYPDEIANKALGLL